MPSAIRPSRISARPWPVPGERHQVRVAEAVADRGGLVEIGVRRCASRPRQIARSRAARGDSPAPRSRGAASSSSRRARASQPPPRATSPPLSRPKASQNAQRAARAASPGQARLMRALPGAGAVVVAADQVRGRREPLQVLGPERGRPIGGRQPREGVGPRLPAVGLPAAIEDVDGSRHGLCCLTLLQDEALSRPRRARARRGRPASTRPSRSGRSRGCPTPSTSRRSS